ncbi:MAG: hypothetical protein HC849_26190 [Oscillatoriales cyanobacterium RU_3_3]|nr:hypothetical protein [Microcoleus sp. SU_5_6]NJL68900.1 hypothetical protein [Microcoleus sp. SM1_3_4]NJM62887.1 hypothetical protein [Oscillatoriales cyanobacterium RU_3_3]NJR24316.1 hypothetical protein [Richelia sp. CSU_2_1]
MFPQIYIYNTIKLVEQKRSSRTGYFRKNAASQQAWLLGSGLSPIVRNQAGGQPT